MFAVPMGKILVPPSGPSPGYPRVGSQQSPPDTPGSHRQLEPTRDHEPKGGLEEGSRRAVALAVVSRSTHLHVKSEACPITGRWLTYKWFLQAKIIETDVTHEAQQRL